MHKPNVLAGKTFFHRGGLVAIFLVILKKNLGACEKKGPFIDTPGWHGTPQHPLFTPYKSLVVAATLQTRMFAIIARCSRELDATICHMRAHVHCGMHHIKEQVQTKTMVVSACPTRLMVG